MTDMKYRELINAIEALLIKEHGVAYINLSRQIRCLLMADKYHELMKAYRERQE
jgi:hypothetical protein